MSSRLVTALAIANVVLGVTALVVVLVTAGWAPTDEGGAPVVVQLAPMIVGFGFVGSFLLHRQPENRVGWILAAVGALASMGTLAEASGAALVGDDRSVRVALTLALLGRTSHDLTIVLAAVLLPALFPSGEVLSPRWRWLPPTALLVGAVSSVSLFVLPDELELAGATYDNPWGLEAASGLVMVVSTVSFVGMLLLALPSVAALVVRFRRATGVERLQLRWFVLSMVSLAASVTLMILWAAAWNLGLLPNPSNLTFDLVVLVGVTTVPLSVGAAVLRYRLYEIDRLVSRAVAYVIVVGLLAGSYLLLVLVLQSGARRITGGSGDLAVALSTLAVAAAARPLLARVRSAVDRRFNRARYDASRTVEGFGRELRDEVSLDAIVRGLRATTASTVQPSAVGVVLVDHRP